MGIFSSTTKTKTEPWRPQGDALKTIFGGAGDLYEQGTYQGDYYAGMNPFTVQGTNALANYGGAGGVGSNIFQSFLNSGNNLMGATDQAYGMAQNFSPYAGAQNQGVDPANLGQYINNGVLSDQIDAASRDVGRNLNEHILTGNAAAAAGSGNLGSSRRGVMDAIATRGAADRIGDISASMRGDAYNQALGMEANRMSQNAGLQQQAGLQGNQFQLQNAQFLNGIGQQGANQLLQANNLGLNNIQNQITAGNAFQNEGQNQISANQQQFNAPWDLLNRYYGIVGSGNWGGTTTSANPLIGQTIGAVAGSAGQLGGAAMMASDARLKNNIAPIDSALDRLSKLRGVTWNWKEGGRPAAGVIAQEIQAVLEGSTRALGRGDMLAVDYAAVNGLAIEAIKELRAHIGEAA